MANLLDQPSVAQGVDFTIQLSNSCGFLRKKVLPDFRESMNRCLALYSASISRTGVFIVTGKRDREVLSRTDYSGFFFERAEQPRVFKQGNKEISDFSAVGARYFLQLLRKSESFHGELSSLPEELLCDRLDFEKRVFPKFQIGSFEF